MESTVGGQIAPFHVLTSSQFDRPFLENIFQLTDAVRKFNKSKEGMLYLNSLANHKRVMLYFTQPSTRTFLSFQSACHILGMRTSEIREAETSSERKGESVEDSLRTFSSYVDIIIIRSPISGLCNRIASILDATDRPVPIINAGSGPDEHPTQALLDLYTLHRSFLQKGGIDGKTICMVGDLKRGRTVRSLSRLLSQYRNMRLLFCSPEEFRIAEDLRRFLQQNASITFEETRDFKSAISEADAVYMTRIQDEYDVEDESARVDTTLFRLREEHLKILKEDCVILHPMPRREELDWRIDKDPRARYWRQERNGMWTRVALLTRILNLDTQVVMPDL